MLLGWIWYISGMDLCTALENVAAGRPESTALIFRGEKVSYADLCTRIRRCAAGLARLGVKRGDKFALMMRNSPEFVIVYYALARLGAVAVPVNFLLKPGEARYIFDHSGAIGAAVQSKFLPGLREAVADLDTFKHIVCCDPTDCRDVTPLESLMAEDTDAPAISSQAQDVSCILYTSGTTGKPKGVMLTHKNLLSNVESCVDAMDLRRNDVFMCLLPMFHTFAWTTCVVLPLTMGSPTVIVESIQPFKDVAVQVRKHKVTIFVAVPPVFSAMSRIPFWRPLRFLLPLRLCVSGAAPLPTEVLEKFESKFGLPLVEGYGLTEASPVVSLNPVNGERRPGTVGLEVLNVEVRTVMPDGREADQGEVGEICVRGPNVMLGYFNDPEATREAIDADGWLHTGDLGRRRQDGYIEIVDRAKDMIIVKGLNVYSREVEDVLLRHPNAAEAAVVGIPDNTGDEIVKAFVVPKEGRRLEKPELLKLCREHLAPYKWPKEVVLAPFLPKNSIGKVLKRELKEGMAAEVSYHENVAVVRQQRKDVLEKSDQDGGGKHSTS